MVLFLWPRNPRPDGALLEFVLGDGWVLAGLASDIKDCCKRGFERAGWLIFAAPNLTT